MGDAVKTKPSPFWLGYFLFSIGFLGLFTAYLASVPFFLIGARKTGGRALCAGVRLLFRVQPWMNGRVDIRPLESRCLLVSNHRSHLDAFLLLSSVPGIRILAKTSLLRVPFLGFMMRVSGQVPARQHDPASYLDALERIGELLSQGERVHVFPEGTRCEPGYRGPLSFSLAPFRVAFQRGIPVVPLAIGGTDQVWPKGSLGLRFGEPFWARTLEPLDPREFSSADELRKAAVSRIDRALAQAVLC